MNNIAINMEKAAEWAEATANDNAHGYAQDNRWGPDYDCSSFVITALRKAGFALNATYTGDMRKALLAAGFKDVTAKVNLGTGSGVQRGDVLLNDSSHTALALGGGKIVQASINEKGTVTGGQTGDQTGKEIYTRSYYNFPWNVVLRYKAVNITTADGPSGTPAPTTGTEFSLNFRILREGCKGEDVRALQLMLKARGYQCGTYGTHGDGADGDFGAATKKQLISYQSVNGLKPDGEAGPDTMGALLGIH